MPGRWARYICSPVMQREADRLYRHLQIRQINSPSVSSEPDQALACGFPFEGPTTVQGIFLPLARPKRDGPPRWLLLRLESQIMMCESHLIIELTAGEVPDGRMQSGDGRAFVVWPGAEKRNAG
jgi:hypothetical protein